MEAVGFDCKVWGDELLNRWSSSRRNQFLLIPTVEVPLSVDTLCWPSVFDTGEGNGLEPAWRDYIGYSGIQIAEDWIGPHSPYWEDLADLQKEIAVASLSPTLYRIVQVLKCTPDPGLSVPLNEGFHAVGYDVADAGFRSSLCNCGYTDEERPELIERFAPGLNEFHLFTSLELARSFAASSDSLVPEHAPFSPYLIAWRLSGDR